MRVFVAGATGVIGRRLVPQLVAAGHDVVATTRSEGKQAMLRGMGAEAVVVDGLDGAAVGEAVARAQPEVVVHQMTALASATSLRRFDRVFAATNALRTAGTDHLLAAAAASGARRVVVQSYTGWPYAREGGAVKTEEDPLDPQPVAAQRESLDAIRYLERAVTGAEGVEGVVLRYAMLYGPGASEPFVDLVRKRRCPLIGKGSGVWSWTHVDDAASAALAALDHGSRGIYNVVDDDPAPVAQWLPALAEAVGAARPMRVPVWLARPLAGEVVVSMMTRVRGASNAKARRELGWQPLWPTWREGFRHGLADDPEALVREHGGRG